MVVGCFGCRRNVQRNESFLSWREFMTAKGRDLWFVRKYIISENKMDEIPLNRTNKKVHGKTLKLVCHHAEFAELEKTKGMDKEKQPTSNKREPLTQTIGEEWIRQRSLVCAAFANIPKYSLEAVKFIDWQKAILAMNDKQKQDSSHHITIYTIDLKELIVNQTLIWVVGLFFGTKSNNTNQIIQNLLLEYWRQARSMVKNSSMLQESLKALEESIHKRTNDSSDGGIYQALLTCGLTKPQAIDNAINAMIASMDAVQSLVFWTLWNLSKSERRWERCKATTTTTTNQEATKNNDLIQLAIFKKSATQGTPIKLNTVSYLCCALLETVRVYPPVWTLPRTFQDDNQNPKLCKVDTLSCNQAWDLDWNPDVYYYEHTTTTNPNPNHHASDDATSSHCSYSREQIGSFGWGKRHCPAGTAGLYAAYEMIQSFLQTCHGRISECQEDRAITSCYLGPTLCLPSPQNFEIIVRDTK